MITESILSQRCLIDCLTGLSHFLTKVRISVFCLVRVCLTRDLETVSPILSHQLSHCLTKVRISVFCLVRLVSPDLPTVSPSPVNINLLVSHHPPFRGGWHEECSGFDHENR
jgi:hypothetical protein